MGNERRLALVTGTSSGLGTAIAESLLEAGWTVVGISRRNVEFQTRNYQHIQADLADSAQLGQIARDLTL